MPQGGGGKEEQKAYGRTLSLQCIGTSRGAGIRFWPRVPIGPPSPGPPRSSETIEWQSSLTKNGARQCTQRRLIGMHTATDHPRRPNEPLLGNEPRASSDPAGLRHPLLPLPTAYPRPVRKPARQASFVAGARREMGTMCLSAVTDREYSEHEVHRQGGRPGWDGNGTHRRECGVGGWEVGDETSEIMTKLFSRVGSMLSGASGGFMSGRGWGQDHRIPGFWRTVYSPAGPPGRPWCPNCRAPMADRKRGEQF